MDELRGRFHWLKRRGAETEEAIGGPASGFDGFGLDGASLPVRDIVGDLVREGDRVRLRTHVPENRGEFQRWYADEEIARLLRHDQRPLNEIQSRGYFDTVILPASARGLCWAIHETRSDRLIGTSALTDLEGIRDRSAYFRIVIGEKAFWGHGYGTEATALVMREGFERQDLATVKLEVFQHNQRAMRAYRRVGFRQTGEHVEFVGRERFELHVVEMRLHRSEFGVAGDEATGEPDGGSGPT